jgi:hypothetical protein
VDLQPTRRLRFRVRLTRQPAADAIEVDTMRTAALMGTLNRFPCISTLVADARRSWHYGEARCIAGLLRLRPACHGSAPCAKG